MLNIHLLPRPKGGGLLLLAVLVLVVSIQPAQAQYLENSLHIFTNGSDGGGPNGVLIFDSKGNLYGTTFSGGDSSGSSAICGTTGCGVIFELSPPSGGSGPWTETVLYTFHGNDGQYPDAGLIFDTQGNLYGTTENGPGRVFELSPPSGGNGPWTLTALQLFGGGSGGGLPGGVIMDSEGNLYGSTSYGGGTTSSNPFCGMYGCGVVYQLSPPSGGSDTWTETVLHAFTGESDGGFPGSLVFDSQGNLYGVAANGGGGNPADCSTFGGCGVIFELSPPSAGSGSWSETVLYTFTGGNDGAYPAGLVFDSLGNLYGTAFKGGDTPAVCVGNSSTPPGCGVVFELSPPSGGSGPWTETVLHTFTGGDDGGLPGGVIFDSKGNLYSTTTVGESVIELSPPSGGNGPWTETVLYTFTDGMDGGGAGGLIFDSAGNLYGGGTGGGNLSDCGGLGCGTIFELSPAPPGTVAAALPVFSPPAGFAVPGQVLTISDATPGATIYYTTNISTPTTGSTPYTGPITLTVPITFEAIAAASGYYTSPVVISHYTVLPPAATPTFSPAPGTYTSAQVVTISDATPSTEILYAINETPTLTSTLYTGPFTVGSTETIEAIAVNGGDSPSAVATATYTINLPPAATPSFSPAPGTYTSAQSVTISDATAGATIYYAINGTPTTASTVYTGAIAVNTTETIEAIAAASGFSASAVASAMYTINPPPNYQVSVTPNTLTIVAGQSGTATFTVTPENGFNSQVTFACSGLPSEAACMFNPPSVTPNGSAIGTTLTLTTTAPSAAIRRPFAPAPPRGFALLYAGFAVMLVLAWRRKRTLAALRMVFLLVVLAMASALASCGGGGSGAGTGGIGSGNPGTPPGTTIASVSASTSGGAQSHGASLTIIVTQ